MPLADMCARVSRIGYNDTCSIELFQPEYWKQDPLLVAQTARASALKVLSPYFELE